MPTTKKDRVADYAKNLVYEVGVISHSCGVAEPRGLHRHHARIVMGNSLSMRLDELHPLPVAPSTLTPTPISSTRKTSSTLSPKEAD